MRQFWDPIIYKTLKSFTVIEGLQNKHLVSILSTSSITQFSLNSMEKVS